MGVLIDGKYYPDRSAGDVERKSPPLAKQARVSGQMREYQRHDVDLIQPYLPSGEPNPEFIKHYPKESVEYGFIKERRD